VLGTMRYSFAFVFVLLLTSCDTVTSHYANVADARENHLFEKGWLPDILPASAHDIVVKSEPDIGICTGEFGATPKDMVGFVSKLESTPRRFRYDKWSKEINHASQQGPIMYFVSDRPVLFAFRCSPSEARCEFWCGDGA
jgi:hypothetical protein